MGHPRMEVGLNPRTGQRREPRTSRRMAPTGWRARVGLVRVVLLCMLVLLPLGGCATGEAAALRVVEHGATGAPNGGSQEGNVPEPSTTGTPSPAPLPQPLMARTWATLNDQPAGLSFAYPSDWVMSGAISLPEGLTFANYSTQDYSSSYLVPPLLTVTVSVRANPQQLSPGDYYNTEISGLGADAEGPTTTTTTTLAEQEALVVNSAGRTGVITPSITYYIPESSLSEMVVVRVEDPAADTTGIAGRMLASLNLAD